MALSGGQDAKARVPVSNAHRAARINVQRVSIAARGMSEIVRIARRDARRVAAARYRNLRRLHALRTDNPAAIARRNRHASRRQVELHGQAETPSRAYR